MKKMKAKKEDKINLFLKLFIALMFLAGAMIFSYPFVVDSLNNFLDQRKIEHYQRIYEEKNAETQKRQLRELEEKNKEIQKSTNIPGMGMVEDPFEEAVGHVKDPDRSYYEEHTLGAIYIPAINVSLPLFDETNDLLLDKGATLLQGTSYPIGGSSTHSVITSHSGLPEKKLFTDLDKLKKGDHFYIEIVGEKLAYEVESFKTVLPNEIDSLVIQEGRDLVTLLTCTPYMINTHRLLVTGFRIPYVEEMTEEIQRTKNYHNIRLIILSTLMIVFLLIFFYWVWRKFVYYQSTKRLYRLKFYWTDKQVPQSGQLFTLLDRRGKPMDNVPTVISQSDGKVDFGELPGNIYRIQLGKEKEHSFKIKAKVWRIKDPQFKIIAKKGHLKVIKAKEGKDYFLSKERLGNKKVK